jgi:response regulator RpfG family c-di-GMP phosphodiesterase
VVVVGELQRAADALRRAFDCEVELIRPERAGADALRRPADLVALDLDALGARAGALVGELRANPETHAVPAIGLTARPDTLEGVPPLGLDAVVALRRDPEALIEPQVARPPR